MVKDGCRDGKSSIFTMHSDTRGVHSFTHTQQPTHTSQIHVYMDPPEVSPHLSPINPKRDSNGRNQPQEHTTLEVKPASRWVREREAASNEFWPLFSTVTFTLSKQALYLWDQLKLTGLRQSAHGSHKADAVGCNTSMPVCLYWHTTLCTRRHALAHPPTQKSTEDSTWSFWSSKGNVTP